MASLRPYSCMEILNRYLTGEPFTYKLPTFYPRKLACRLKGLGPAIHLGWQTNASGDGRLSELPFRDVMSLVERSVGTTLSSWPCPPGIESAEWDSWRRDFVRQLRAVEHAVNAGLCWTLGQMEPTEVGLLFNAVAGTRGPLRVFGGGFEASGAHTSQWDGFLSGPESGVLIEIKARGKSARTRFEESQLAKCVDTCRRLRDAGEVGAATPISIALIAPRGVSDRNILGRSLADSWSLTARAEGPVGSPRRRVDGPPELWHLHFEDLTEAAESLGFAKAAESLRFVAELASPRVG